MFARVRGPRLLIAAWVTASGALGLLVAAPAAADCVEAADQTLSLCSQGDVRVDPMDRAEIVTGPLYPYPCDYDYYCKEGVWDLMDITSR